MKITFALVCAIGLILQAECFLVGVKLRRPLGSRWPTSTCRKFGLKERRMGPRDFIDVDVDSGSRPGEEEETGKGRAGSSLFRSGAGSDSDEQETGLIGGITSAIGTGLAKVFGGNKKSLGARKKKMERKKEMDTAIDSIFDEVGAGKGIAGGIMKAAVKGLGGMISDMATDYASDFGEIQELVLQEIKNDSKAKFMVGDSVQVGAPFQSSSYSSSINGVTTKRMSVVIPVAGTKGQAQAEVEASSREDGLVSLESLCISNGVSRTVIISPGGRGPPRGGGRRGGSGGRGGGDVIDVEVV